MFRHVGIVVDDMNRMSNFYQDVIGLELMYNEVEEGEFLEHIVNKKGARAHIQKLGKHGDTIVELLKWDETNEAELEGGPKMFTWGVTHFALTVDDLDAIYDKYQKEITFISLPKTNDNKTHRVAFCYDAEGNIIELVECISEE
jgi:catechol 2,3-dioxygenase-like lactoylglutathione lyase family enzyme